MCVCVCVSVGAESEKPVGEAVELPTHLSWNCSEK